MSGFLILLRSLVYDVAFFFWALFASLACYLVARIKGQGPALNACGRLWQQGAAFLEETILGLTTRITGLEHMPKGCCIVAMQHQSAWETMKLMIWFDAPAIVLKAELLKLPMWGEAMRVYGAIPVARSRKMDDLKKMLKAAEGVKAQNRPIVIFPQGTRTKPGVKKALQGGVGVLYEHLNVPVVPVTLNSGEFWGREAFKKYPGAVQVTFYPAIPPGLPRDELMARLDAVIYGEPAPANPA